MKVSTTTHLPAKLAILGLLVAASAAHACPFCTVTSQTLSEEIAAADVVVLARLINGGLQPEPGPDALGGFGAVDPDTGNATFTIYDVLQGKDHVVGMEEIETVFFGPPEKEKSFMITGTGTSPIVWGTPLPLSETAVDYTRQLLDLPEKGADRLAFFQKYLEHEDPLLAQDAYDEFARAPYDEVLALGPRMDHDQLMAWITDPEVSPSRRRLYLTMLSVCGSEEDLPLLEEMIASDYSEIKPALEGLVQLSLATGGPMSMSLVPDVVKLHERGKKLGLDAMIACYLTLGGADGLDLIDRRFLTDPDTEYTHVYSTIMALRFHGEETDVIPRERLLQSVRLLLDNPDFADQVMPDLARWEDWGVLDRMVQMFKDADDKSFVRQPVITYLTVASEQEGEVGQRATAALEELEELDPETVERARSLMAFGFLARARPEGDMTNATREWSEQAKEAETSDSGPPDPSDPEYNEDTSSLAATLEAENQTSVQIESQPEGEPVAGEETTGEATDPAASTETVADVSVDPQPAPPHRLMIIGVPLLAGVLLMGMYWLILRSGSA